MEVDGVTFGRLVQAVETLTEEVAALRTSVGDMKEQLAGGKGLLVGLTLAAGGIGAAAHKGLEVLFK